MTKFNIVSSELEHNPVGRNNNLLLEKLHFSMGVLNLMWVIYLIYFLNYVKQLYLEARMPLLISPP